MFEVGKDQRVGARWSRVRLDWSEQGRYDLSDERQRNLKYERVIRESMRVEDLRTYLHGPTLRRRGQLWLPERSGGCGSPGSELGWRSLGQGDR